MAGRVTAVDHVGYVVTNLEQALRFFIDVLGFEDINRRGVLRADDSDRMTRLFGVHPRAVGNYAFLAMDGRRVELLEWTSPDQNETLPRNCDLGGRHIALAVSEIEEFLARIAREPGISVRERNDLGFYYVGTPFGLEIQIVPQR
jgi:catechol 2,3-dioxygenase-like lactoylglutathione lyase family enzyme